MRRKSISLLLCGILSLSLIGCGDAKVAPSEGTSITLIEPVNATYNYEAAAYRTIYDAVIYPATVVPYIEEYSAENGMTFDHYGAFFGDTVKKGQTLIYSDDTSIENQIEAMEKQIESMDESYEEFMQNKEEELAKKKQALANLQGYMDAYNANPESYDQKVADVQLIGPYKTTEHAINTIKLNMEQRTELYELDRERQVYLLSQLKEQKKDASVVSEMSGVLVSMAFDGDGSFLTEGDRINADTPVAAVADMNQRLVKCDYINATKIKKANDIYAIIDGKRYELEYHPMDAEEYVRLDSLGEKVYTTFTLLGWEEDIQVGDFAVIALMNDVRTGVLSVPTDAIEKDDTGRYVSVKKDSTNKPVYIKTGITDGVYTEVLSGVEEGDEILVEKAGKTGKSTTVLKKSNFNTPYENNARMDYPSTSVMISPIENGTTYFGNALVERFQQIKKGDEIATVRVEADEVALQRNETKRTRLLERMADLEEMDAEANAEQIANMKEQLADLEETIAKQKSDFATTIIKADRGGVVLDIIGAEEETIISPKSYMLAVADEGTCFLATEDTNHVLQFGDKLTVTYNTQEQKGKTVTGTVVSMAPIGVSKAFVSDYTYIAVPADKAGEIFGGLFAQDRGRWSMYPYQLNGVVRNMDNVLVVPKKAVTEKNGNTYVSVVKENGEIVAQRFVAGGYNANNYWVVEGLTEGMEICLE